jgi:hypothetical protein
MKGANKNFRNRILRIMKKDIPLELTVPVWVASPKPGAADLGTRTSGGRQTIAAPCHQD